MLIKIILIYLLVGFLLSLVMRKQNKERLKRLGNYETMRFMVVSTLTWLPQSAYSLFRVLTKRNK